MPSAWAEKLDKLEKLHDEMERDQDSQRERGKNYMQISSETEGPEMPPTEKGDRSPAVMKHDSHNTPEIDESCSPTSSNIPELERQMRHLSMQLASERRIRRAVENEFSRHERLTAELQQTLLAEQVEKQDLVERLQRADDDYLAAQEKLVKSNAECQANQRQARSAKDEAHAQVEKYQGRGIQGMTVEQLEALEHEQEESLARVRAAKVQRQRVELEKVQRELEELHERRLCVVCRENDIQVIIMPCSHACLCQDCGELIQRSASALCPMCREPILEVSTIYVS